MSRRRTLRLFASSLVLVACSTSPPRTKRRLPSGSEVAILSSGKVYFGEEKTFAFQLTYETGIPFSDERALRAEVEEVMSVVRSAADAEGFFIAAFTVEAPPSGIVFKTSKRRNFVLRKNAAGEWKLV